MTKIPAGFSRFSVNYLIALVINADIAGVSTHLGLLWRKGTRKTPPVYQYSAIGGGALLTDAGLALVKSVGGILEEPDGRDARFFIPDEHVVEFARRFREEHSGLLVEDMHHELLSELAGDELGQGAILSPSDLQALIVEPIGWAVMAGSPILRPGDGNQPDEPTRKGSERLIRGFTITAPSYIYDTLVRHESVREFSETEVERTKEGRVVAKANDEVTNIGNNMFLPSAFTR